MGGRHRDSEFPSLSGTSQPQYQNQSQAIWANQRAVQQNPVQRPNQQHPIASQTPQQHQHTQQVQDQSQRPSEDILSATSHLTNAIDDHRYGGTGTLGQLSASRQPQTTNVDDFPPLGRNGTDENDDRRSSIMQNSGFGGFSSTNAFSLPPDQAQARNTLPSASSSQANNTRSSSVVDRLTSPNGIGFGGKARALASRICTICSYATQLHPMGALRSNQYVKALLVHKNKIGMWVLYITRLFITQLMERTEYLSGARIPATRKHDELPP